MTNKAKTYYWQMLFYFFMALVIALAGIYFRDFSWLILAAGAACLGLSNRMSYQNIESKSSTAGTLSRIGFLVIASALLVNVLNSTVAG